MPAIGRHCYSVENCHTPSLNRPTLLMLRNVFVRMPDSNILLLIATNFCIVTRPLSPPDAQTREDCQVRVMLRLHLPVVKVANGSRIRRESVPKSGIIMEKTHKITATEPLGAKSGGSGCLIRAFQGDSIIQDQRLEVPRSLRAGNSAC